MSNSPLIRTQARTTSRLVPTQHIRAALGMVLLFTFVAAGYTVLEPVTGFGKRELWDWLSLGGVSLTIFLVGLLVTRRQKEREEAATLEHTQDAALAAYLDQMSDLMIDRQLGKARKDKDSLEDSVRNVAQARTVAVLLGLDKEHKRRPLKLVYELRLIDTDTPVLELRNAALDGANLSELTLRKAYLKGVDLRACANREHIRMQYGHGCLIIRGVSEASRVEGANPCPPSNHTSSNPFGNSLLPSCQSERPIIRLAAIDLASQTG
jgi:hypothetical protein